MNTQNLKKTIATSLFSALIVATITACQEEVNTDESPAALPVAPSASSLQGTAWRVEDIAGRGVVDRSHTTLHFTRQGQASGDTGCNRYTSRLQIGDGTIAFGVPGGTRKACIPALMDQEAGFYEAISKAVSWEIADTGLLYLRDVDGNDQIRAAATNDP